MVALPVLTRSAGVKSRLREVARSLCELEAVDGHNSANTEELDAARTLGRYAPRLSEGGIDGVLGVDGDASNPCAASVISGLDDGRVVAV